MRNLLKLCLFLAAGAANSFGQVPALRLWQLEAGGTTGQIGVTAGGAFEQGYQNLLSASGTNALTNPGGAGLYLSTSVILPTGSNTQTLRNASGVWVSNSVLQTESDNVIAQRLTTTKAAQIGDTPCEIIGCFHVSDFSGSYSTIKIVTGIEADASAYKGRVMGALRLHGLIYGSAKFLDLTIGFYQYTSGSGDAILERAWTNQGTHLITDVKAKIESGHLAFYITSEDWYGARFEADLEVGFSDQDLKVISNPANWSYVSNSAAATGTYTQFSQLYQPHLWTLDAYNRIFNTQPTTPIHVGNLAGASLYQPLTVRNFAPESVWQYNNAYAIRLRTTGAGSYTGLTFNGTNDQYAGFLGKLTDDANSYGSFLWATRNSVNINSRMMLDENGNLGISTGVSSVSDKLEVGGKTSTTNLKITSLTTANNLMKLTNSSGDVGSIAPNQVGLYSGSGSLSANTVVTFGTNSLTFDASGATSSPSTPFLIKGKESSFTTRFLEYQNESAVTSFRGLASSSLVTLSALNSHDLRLEGVANATIATGSDKNFVVNTNGYIQPHNGLSSDPSSPPAASIWYRSDLSRFKIREGSSTSTVATVENDFAGLYQIYTSSHTAGSTGGSTEFTFSLDANGGAITETLGGSMMEGYDYVMDCRRNATNAITVNAASTYSIRLSGSSTVSLTTFTATAHTMYSCRRLGTVIFVK